MIHGAIPSNSIPTIGYAMSASSSGRMSLPVAPASVIYSHFKHVSGVPAPEGSRGVSISKLKILDVLIEQLSQVKRQGNDAHAMGAPVSDEHIDAMIDFYKTQIQQTKAASAAMPYIQAPSAQAGAVFSFTV